MRNVNISYLNVTDKMKEKKLKKGFSSQSKTRNKFNLAVSSNLLQ